jgi:6,7-dimethyl-8-ribityllumazine synthase
MLNAAREIFAQVAAEVSVVEVGGAYELPQALAIAEASGKGFDGYIALGCVVRGETDHYEFICAAAMNGLMRVATDKALCLGAALLTVDTLAQAMARSRETGSNKGAEAAVACLKQIALKRSLAA